MPRLDPKLVLIVLVPASLGCGLVLDYDFQPAEGDAAGVATAGAVPAGSGAASSGAGGGDRGGSHGEGGRAAEGGAGGGPSVSSASSSAASSGAGTSCGNGSLEAGEECDDANTVAGDGCEACLVVCDVGETKGPPPFHCYRVDYSGNSWSSARSQCLSWGGDLAAVGDDAEQAFIHGLNTATTSWIGGSDMNEDGWWLWSNGEPWSYAHWDVNEPNNNDGNERCLEMRNSGYWNDRPCDTVYASICERIPAGT